LPRPIRKKADNKFQNPPSAYLLFIADQKNKLKNDNVIPKEAKDQSTFFSNLWKKVTDADKEVRMKSFFVSSSFLAIDPSGLASKSSPREVKVAKEIGALLSSRVEEVKTTPPYLV